MSLDQSLVVSRTEAFVKELLTNSEKGHDWLHAHRVRLNALNIAKTEPGDKLIIELAALLHDIEDHKFQTPQEENRLAHAMNFLHGIHIAEHDIEQIFYIIRNISFSNDTSVQHKTSNELNIVQDADRLDALGAIGIARAFHYGGFKNREMYNPLVKPELFQIKEDYKRSTGPTLNHFYEKLLLLKDLMNTDTAKKMAEQRHLFMKTYLQQLYAECYLEGFEPI
jgi:uncharacterized protein